MALRATKDGENRLWGKTPVLRPTSTSARGSWRT